jgi:hypothetical protein
MMELYFLVVHAKRLQLRRSIGRSNTSAIALQVVRGDKKGVGTRNDCTGEAQQQM